MCSSVCVFAERSVRARVCVHLRGSACAEQSVHVLFCVRVRVAECACAGLCVLAQDAALARSGVCAVRELLLEISSL